MSTESEQFSEAEMREASRRVGEREKTKRYSAAFVFAVMLLGQVAIDIALPNSRYATLDTANLGDLLYIAGLLISFWKAVS